MHCTANGVLRNTRILFVYCTLLHYHTAMHCNLNSAKEARISVLTQVLPAKKHQPHLILLSPKSIKSCPSRKNSTVQSSKHEMQNLKCNQCNL